MNLLIQCTVRILSVCHSTSLENILKQQNKTRGSNSGVLVASKGRTGTGKSEWYGLEREDQTRAAGLASRGCVATEPGLWARAKERISCQGHGSDSFLENILTLIFHDYFQVKIQWNSTVFFCWVFHGGPMFIEDMKHRNGFKNFVLEMR